MMSYHEQIVESPHEEDLILSNGLHDLNALSWDEKHHTYPNNLNVEAYEIGIDLKNQFEAYGLLDGWVD